MIIVKVMYYGKLRELLGVKNEEYAVEKGTTLTDLLTTYISGQHSEVSKTWVETIFRTIKGVIVQNKNGVSVLGNYLVLVNGKSTELKEKLKEGDEVTIMPPFGGG
jgi:molybdopterin converting factor small subunit